MKVSKRQKFCLPAPHPREVRERARSLYESGEDYQAIHEITGLPLSTLRNWRKRDGWERARSQPEPESEPLTVVPAESEEPIDVPGRLPEMQEIYTERMAAAAIRLSEHVSKLDGGELVKQADRLLKADKTARAALKLETDRRVPVIQIGVLCQPVTESKPLHSYARPRRISSE